MTSTASIVQLQSDWFKFSDLDRARAVYAIHQSEVSIRSLAKALNQSESLLRHLLTALQAPATDRLLAKLGKISTNELARRARAVGLAPVAKAGEAQRFEHAKEAAAGCRLICEWLEAENFQKAFGKQVIVEAQRQLAIAELKGEFPKDPAPPDTPLAEIIRRLRPPLTMIDEFCSTAFYGDWLARWAWFAFPDPGVRDQALDLALGLSC